MTYNLPFSRQFSTSVAKWKNAIGLQSIQPVQSESLEALAFPLPSTLEAATSVLFSQLAIRKVSIFFFQMCSASYYFQPSKYFSRWSFNPEDFSNDAEHAILPILRHIADPLRDLPFPAEIRAVCENMELYITLINHLEFVCQEASGRLSIRSYCANSGDDLITLVRTSTVLEMLCDSKDGFPIPAAALDKCRSAIKNISRQLPILALGQRLLHTILPMIEFYIDASNAKGSAAMWEAIKRLILLTISSCEAELHHPVR